MTDRHKQRTDVSGGQHGLLDVTTTDEANPSKGNPDTIQEENRRLREMLTRLPDNVFCFGADGICQYANQETFTWSNKATTSLVGRHLDEFMPPELASPLGHDILHATKSQTTLTHRFEISTESERMIVEARILPTLEDKAVVIIRDISEQVRIEKGLERRDAILSAVTFAAERFLRGSATETTIRQFLKRLGEATEVSRVFIFRNVVLDDGRDGIEFAFEWKREDVPPLKQADPLDSQGRRPWTSEKWYSTLSAGGVISGGLDDFEESERRIIEAFGAQGVTIAPIMVGNRWWGLFGFSSRELNRIWTTAEVRSLRTAAMVLGAALEAEDVNRMKTSFLANMSHEIRTPLTSIIGYASLLNNEVDGKGKEFAQLIRAGADRLMDTLISVLDFAQLEGDSVRVVEDSVDIRNEVNQIWLLYRSRYKEKGVQFNVERIDPSLSNVKMDKRAFGRVLINLVDNALKFTEENGVVTVRAKADQEKQTMSIEVTDTGIGVNPRFLPHIFEAFKQESDGLGRRYGGNGLGLAITKKLVDLLGGEIGVKSEVGEGTVFEVKLPLKSEK